MSLVFCARCMTRSKLLGYYSIANNWLIPLWDKYPKAKTFMVRTMVEPFYEYMRFRTGHRESVSWTTRLFSRSFLALCDLYYALGLPLHFPQGYEKCIRSAGNNKGALKEIGT